MKIYLASSGQHNWPSIADDVQDRILHLINECFNEEKVQCSLKRPKKRKKDSPISLHPIKQHLAIGLRTVMRCLKQKQCILVLVCTSLVPIILTKPILLLSQMHSIPAIRMKNLSTLLMSIFAIPHCSVLGLKVSSEDNEHFKEFLHQIRSMIGDQSDKRVNKMEFLPGKILAPYQNPKRMSAGVKKQKPKKK